MVNNVVCFVYAEVSDFLLWLVSIAVFFFAHTYRLHVISVFVMSIAHANLKDDTAEPLSWEFHSDTKLKPWSENWPLHQADIYPTDVVRSRGNAASLCFDINIAHTSHTTMKVVTIGVSRNVCYYTALRILQHEHEVVILLRNPSTLIDNAEI